jgi:hypothetical protein
VIKYFVSYVATIKDNIGSGWSYYGAIEITRETPISSMANINGMITKIKEYVNEKDGNNVVDLVITNWQRFEEE